MSKTLEIIRESVHAKHRARNEAIKRILARHKAGVINQSAANQQLKSCGHPGLNVEEWRVENPKPKEHIVYHDDSEVARIKEKGQQHSGVYHPTGKKFTTGSHSNALKVIRTLHSNHIRANEEKEDDHHGFTPNQMIKRHHDGEIKDARYLGPHHNKEYARIINHLGKKVTDKWENLIKESLPADATSSDYVDDFVHSKNKMFAGDSKKQRIKRALGAYYAKHKQQENVSINEEHKPGDKVKVKFGGLWHQGEVSDGPHKETGHVEVKFTYKKKNFKSRFDPKSEIKKNEI